VVSDYGEDLDCIIFVDHRRTSLHFRCQVKSTASIEDNVRRLKSGSFSVSISTSLCKLWLLSYFPILLVVYDTTTGIILWANATEQIQNAIGKLSQKTLTLHISRQDLLPKSQARITEIVQHFYSQLLRLSSRALTCQVYPVVMPGYRAIPFTQIIHVSAPEQLPDGLQVKPTTRDKDWLPAWTTAIKTLDQHFIAGWEVTAPGGDIQNFSSALRNTLFELQISTEGSDWISFVCSPVEFKASEDIIVENSFWNKMLTNWWNYTRFGSVLISDEEYAFALPSGFLKQIARRATSWEAFHHVDPVRDVAIQLFSDIATTPGVRWDLSAMRQHIQGQFVSWTCPSKEVDQLLEVLRPSELVFRKVGNIPTIPGHETGIICTFFFEPRVGLFTPAHTWNEFTDGTVKWRLESTGILSKIPGSVGPPEVAEMILNMFGDRRDESPNSLMISEKDYSSGLPLDHQQRRIWVQRFREVGTLNHATVNKIFEECKRDIVKLLGTSQWVECSFDMFEAFPAEQIAELSVTWQPLLEESSAQSFERLAPTILGAFERVLPRKSRRRRKTLSTTYDVLRYAGSLCFEGDENSLPWSSAK
jgi:Domain of unknown function (DUF4365)